RLAVAQIPDRLAVLDDVGNDVELRMLLDERLAIWVRARRIELAEPSAECNELRIRQLLPLQHHDKALAPDMLDRFDLIGRQRLGSIDIAHDRAEDGIEILDRYRHRLL